MKVIVLGFASSLDGKHPIFPVDGTHGLQYNGKVRAKTAFSFIYELLFESTLQHY